jgi:hypothetical protein
MSYSGLENYGAYYGDSADHQNAEDTYHAGRSSGSSATIPGATGDYQASARQSQHNGVAYNWPGQSQQNYGTVSGDTESYENSAWRGINSQHGQRPAYDFQRQHTSHSNSSTNTGAGQEFYSSTNQSATQPSMQGLNNLAYASGLEFAGLNEGNHGIRTREAGSTAFNAPRTTSTPQARAPSPTQTGLPRHFNQRPAPTYPSHTHSQSKSAQQDLAASAAAALAGPVSRRQSNQQSPALTYHQPSTTTKTMGNGPSSDAYNRPRSHLADSTSNASASNTSRGMQQSAQHSWAPSSHSANPQAYRYTNTSNPDPATLTSKTKPQAQNRVSNQTLPSSQSGSHLPNITAPNNSSITNLVTNTSPQDSPLLDPPQQTAQSDWMPCFIDPSQVFNPFHTEYERRKREAFETKAETRSKAAEKPVEKSETGSQIVVPTSSTAPRTTASCSIAPDKPEKAEKREENKSRPVLPSTSSPPTAAPSQTTSATDADMASEMKAMIERMREWKNKDPALFSKLWDDMKKGGAAPSAPTGSTPKPSPQIAQAEISQNRSANTLMAASSSKVADVWKLQSPGLPSQLNGHKVVVEHNNEGLPDLGRFPAERRYRQSYTKRDKDVSNRRDETSSTMPLDRFLAHPLNSGPQPVPQPLPARTSSGNTLWPEEKRRALAEAAVKVLNTEPANREIGIKTEAIRDLLEQNPSFIDLCKLLEDRGLRFHRGQFARQLLANVPDLATSQTKAGPEPSQNPIRTDIGPSSTRPAAAQTISMPSTTSAVRPYVNESHPGPVKAEIAPQIATLNSQFVNQSPNYHVQHPSSTTIPLDTPTSQAAKARLGVPSPSLPPPVPGSKDALSRKRHFSELVDLTQLSDDEDYVMPSKQPRLEEPSPEPEVFKVGTDISTHGSVSAGQPSQGRSAFAQSLQFNPHEPRQVLAPVQRPRAILARPINKSEALRKSYYDPKTVARDILIAAGRHPSERPLNAHYAGLLHRHIELDSDLSTFDWDVIDPGGPPMPRVQMVDIPAGPPKWKLGVQRRGPRSMRGDQPIGEHSPQPANPTSAITSFTRLSAQTKILLEDSQRAANAAGPNPSPLRHSQLVDTPSPDGVDTTVTPQKRKASLTPTPSPPRTRSSRSTSLRVPKSVESERNMENPNVKRRGRPPGAKNKHLSLAAMKKAANTSPLVAIPSRPRSPPPLQFEVYDCQWRKCNAKLHNLATLRKHISKVHRPSTEEAIKWGHTCWWKKCRTLVRNEDKTVTPKERFQSHSEWMDHIEEDHLHPLGMEKGDGPSTSHIGKAQLNSFDVQKYLYRPPEKSCEHVTRTVSYLDPQSIATDRALYLSDEHGRTVTAPATNATNNLYAPDALILSPTSNDAEERVPIKQYMRAHGNEKMDLKTSATETLRAMEVKKERVGPGMDRGGCTLVNNERRATLLQNEGIARVVMDDD